MRGLCIRGSAIKYLNSLKSCFIPPRYIVINNELLFHILGSDSNMMFDVLPVMGKCLCPFLTFLNHVTWNTTRIFKKCCFQVLKYCADPLGSVPIVLLHKILCLKRAVSLNRIIYLTGIIYIIEYTLLPNFAVGYVS